MSKRELQKISREIQEIKAGLIKTSASELLGELEYYPVTKRGRTTYEVIIDWADNKVWRSEEAIAIQRDLDTALHVALKKFRKKHPNLK